MRRLARKGGRAGTADGAARPAEDAAETANGAAAAEEVAAEDDIVT